MKVAQKTVGKLFLLPIVSLIVSGTPAFAIESAPVKSVPTTIDSQPVHILANTFEQTMYIFDPDLNGVPTCYEKCAEIWPPLLLTDSEGASLQAPYSFVARKNGLKQLRIDGKPIYGYFKDRKAGDILGDGLGDVWHIVITDREQ